MSKRETPVGTLIAISAGLGAVAAAVYLYVTIDERWGEEIRRRLKRGDPPGPE